MIKHHEAFVYTLSDIKGIDPSTMTHKITMLEDVLPIVDTHRRLNTKKEVVRKEVIRLLDVSIIYPISYSKWASPAHCIPRHGGLDATMNKDGDLVPIRPIVGYRMCIDFRKLNRETQKNHKPILFMDRVLERLINNSYLFSLDGYSGYSQISIQPEDQEKTTFTCPYGTYANRLILFGLCNAVATFQECVLKIFDDLVEKTMQVLTNDFVVCGTTFDNCLYNLTICRDARNQI